jgi:hypothetical protein
MACDAIVPWELAQSLVVVAMEENDAVYLGI